MTFSDLSGAPEDPIDATLPWPISFEAKYGAGKEHAIVLGGGGVYFVAWQVSYLNGLMKRGVALEKAEIIIGTSAGSLVASILAGGGLKRFGKQVDWIAKVPALVHLLAPASNFHPSQVRALNMFRAADNSRPETIQAIGHAALAAMTPSAAEMRRSTGFAIASRGWPSPALHISTVDTYTGERLIITQDAQVSAIRAAAASSAVPGIFTPQPIHDRRCMDGGVSGSGSHCDVVAGAKRALVVALGAGLTQSVATMTIQPNSLDDEVAALEASGTATMVRGPREVDLAKLMDPQAVPEAIAMAEEQAAEDALVMADFWNA
jgi:NTE family protein